MRQHGKSFLQEAENQENGDGIAVAWDGISGRGDSEIGCGGTYICNRFRFSRARDHEKKLLTN